MPENGYYHHPTLFKDTVVFVSEDDLWQTTLSGAPARRLTSGLGAVSCPVFSPDGAFLAFSASSEGHGEVYVMPALGGEAKRLTFLGDTVAVLSWTSQGIYFATAAGSPFERLSWIWRVSPEGGVPEQLPLGPATSHMLHNHTGPGAVIQRLGYREYGYWKRYRGGTAGTLWIDEQGEGVFRPLITLKANLARPLWVGQRIYFASDHEGVGNLYSCNTEGADLKRHTDHLDFYVRNQQTDGSHIVYQAGADLYTIDLDTGKSQKLCFDYHSSRPERARKFVSAERYCEDIALHPKGHHLALTARGKPFVFGKSDGPVLQLGQDEGVRYRLPCWLHDGTRVLVVCDQEGEESLELYDAARGERLATSQSLDFGRLRKLVTSPTQDAALLVNQKGEILHLDLTTWTMTLLDRSAYEMVNGVSWSPDGRWVAYHCSLSQRRSAIKIADPLSGEIHQVTDPVLKDHSPVFDPEGTYLYFLSCREFNPNWDSLHFDLGFPAGMRPYLITLRKDLDSPFEVRPSALAEDEKEDKEDQEDKGTPKDNAKKDAHQKEEENKIPEVTIDFEGIQDRIVAFPVEPGVFSGLRALKGKVLYLSWPLVTSEDDKDGPDEGGALLEAYDFESQKAEDVVQDVLGYDLSLDHQHLVYKTGRRLRVLKIGDKIETQDDSTNPRKSGWVDLSRLRVSVTPALEWPQIYQEAWRLQRDHFWVEDMSQIDWQRVYDRYWPLVSRVSTRRELTDLIWEMQGELGTSHAYVFGGDMPAAPSWTVGRLGARFRYSSRHKAFEITALAKGDLWQASRTSPLNQVGIQAQVGDLLHQINGQGLSPKAPPEALLTHQAGQEVRLTLSDPKDTQRRDVTVRTLRSETPLHYRDWVESNRRYVHEKTQGRVGYVHIPDMSPGGFAEFHRGFLAECGAEGLIVDIRYNGGGLVSPLLLEKLVRKRLGYDLTRWMGHVPYPEESTSGRLVALVNEHAGSDGDIFAHAFKALKLGPLIGTRTWGGVIGIYPRNPLVDGGLTTQPEFSGWFEGIGWGLENYGVDPDIVIDNTPKDYAAGRDAQLERGLEEVLKILEKNPIPAPDFGQRPNLSIPNRLKAL